MAPVLTPVAAAGSMASNMGLSFLPRPFVKKNSGVKWTEEEVSLGWLYGCASGRHCPRDFLSCHPYLYLHSPPC